MAAVHFSQYHTYLPQPIIIKYKENYVFATKKDYCCCYICNCVKNNVYAFMSVVELFKFSCAKNYE